MCKKQLIFGIGVNDYDGHVRINGKIIKSYDVWHSMIERCYSNNYQEKQPTYIGCYVCEEWLLFTNFKKWYETHYRLDYHLDKDILFKGNKLYSPETCSFVPQEVNKLFTNRKNDRGNLPIGVSYSKKYNKFQSQINIDGERKHLGYFITAKDAYLSYKKEKEKNIKEMAEKYFKLGLISLNVYNAMMIYDVNIND